MSRRLFVTSAFWKAMTAKKRFKYYHCRDWWCGAVKTIPEPEIERQFIGQLTQPAFHISPGGPRNLV
ncbi:MAG: hypothetical protein A3A28_03970 [Candidatus Sungbacteria bacterium RIFCSPLOWO2_01_FULL_47_32]|uniref:Uncharacterized protein n=1 Tax=Candidatus Sungbacteria bacterium RIFCSPHIGHO2_01_FULL_47_32 TaxID=1802264 RepID=A0A1G2K458_9BACT|nr:MAG: hypothetical protein A2633_01610 [Candidatus Sungbacteria bacterium RIFCSPHIGHO2_01_FULL_47_32]OHA05065.1 MAG: hypothetical protein A3A28_03970 [Candidatus Sungbacteria bacterium RIFCSPLOWO2_01_FULL_47_32]